MTTEIYPAQPTSGEEKRPDPQVVERPHRRTFTAEKRMAIRHEADACTKPGQLGALMRREGIYWSYLTDWRKQRDKGTLGAAHGRKPANPSNIELAKLQRENAKLTKELSAAKMVISVQKNVAALLGIALESAENDSRTTL